MMLLLVPFFLQGLAMFADEFYFHRQRGLPLWERVGHPLDSLTVLVCYLFIALQAPTALNMNIYIGLCAFSCVFITKDEFIHTEKCSAEENWLHSILFILHPLTFLSAGLIWKENLNAGFLVFQPALIFIFMMYQIIYWSLNGSAQRKS